jgi:Uma2 family endonuclease
MGLRLSADEYLALPDDGFKYQVINGVVLMSPSPTPWHQLVQLEFATQLQLFFKAHPIARVFPDIDVRFAADLVYRPDLVVVLNERLPKPLRRIDVVPDLIVEILSPGSEAMDERTKLADYERFGVKEYWIVTPVEPFSIRVFRLHEGKLVESSSNLTSNVLPGFRLDIESIKRSIPS